MKILFLVLSLSLALPAFASWQSDSRATLNEYGYACPSTQVKIESIVANSHIKGRVVGLPTEALKEFKVVFYVKTNKWYVHPYTHYTGQEEGFSYSNLNSKGEFGVKSVRRTVPAKELAAVLVPKAYKIKDSRFLLKPFLGVFGGVLKYSCAHTRVKGNGDF